MEGVRCHSCGVHSFVSFNCKYCDLNYCEQHQTRQNHACVDTETSTSVNPSVTTTSGPTFREMVSSVENRFNTPSAALPESATRTHFNISSSTATTTTAKEAIQRSQNSAQRLLSRATAKPTTTKAAEGNALATRMVIKAKAKGLTSTPMADRIALAILFVGQEELNLIGDESRSDPPPGWSGVALKSIAPNVEVVYYYYNKNSTLADVMNTLLTAEKSRLMRLWAAENQPFEQFDSAVLVCASEGRPRWQEWSRRARLGDLVEHCSVLYVSPVRAETSMLAQRELQSAT